MKCGEGKPRAAVLCQHHWLIDRPSGPTSKGVCKHCGEEREFRNSCEEDWSFCLTPHELRKKPKEFAEMLDKPIREPAGSLNTTVELKEEKKMAWLLSGVEAKKRHDEIMQMLPKIRQLWKDMAHDQDCEMITITARLQKLSLQTGISESTLRKMMHQGLLEGEVQEQSEDEQRRGISGTVELRQCDDITDILDDIESLLDAEDQTAEIVGAYIKGVRRARKVSA